MTLDHIEGDADLGQLLHERAAASSQASLVAQATTGSVLVAVFGWLQPAYWPILVCAGVASTMHGVWGATILRLSDSLESDRRISVRVLEIARTASSLVGVTAAFGFLVSVLFLLLGRWIS